MFFFNMQWPPHLFQQLPVGDDFACRADERSEELVLYRREMDLLIGHKHLTSTELYANVTKSKAGVRVRFVRTGRMPQGRAYSCK